MSFREHILCAAIHYNDGKTYDDQPSNIESGIVITGRRHHNAISTLEQLMPDHNPDLVTRENQGFITASNRYVDRKEAYQIAKKAGQLLMNLDEQTEPLLISENLY